MILASYLSSIFEGERCCAKARRRQGLQEHELREHVTGCELDFDRRSRRGDEEISKDSKRIYKHALRILYTHLRLVYFIPRLYNYNTAQSGSSIMLFQSIKSHSACGHARW